MSDSQLTDISFDKGNGALFRVTYDGESVRCFIRQDNEFVVNKGKAGMDFIRVVERYQRLIYKAALINIEANGICKDVWGNLITAGDIDSAINFSKLGLAR